jgi:hypothetical protein
VLRGGYGIFFVPRNIQGNGDGAIEAFRDTPMVAASMADSPTPTVSAIRSRKASCRRSTIGIRWPM